jgi:transcriptional regulator with XRE-family HTH domain
MAPVHPDRPASPLRDARESKRLRQADVAKTAGCSIALVSMVEAGYMPPEPTRARIAEAVGATLGSFWP